MTRFFFFLRIFLDPPVKPEDDDVPIFPDTSM